MATNKKSMSRTGKKTGSTKGTGKIKSSAGKTPKEKTAGSQRAIYREAALIFSFLVSVILFLSNFGLCGAVGNILKTAQTGFFGAAGYVFPAVLFISIIFYISNMDNSAIWLKLLAVFFVLLSVDSIIYCIFGTRAAGGILGEFFAGAVTGLLGKAGCIVISLAILIISAVFITEKSFVKAVGSGSRRAYDSARENARIRKHLDREQRLIDFEATDLMKHSDSLLDESTRELAKSVSEIQEKEEDVFVTPKDEMPELDPDIFVGKIKKPVNYPDDGDGLPYNADYAEMDEAFDRANEVLVSPGTQRVVTSTGKIIESDIDGIKRKMTEARRNSELGQVREQVEQHKEKASLKPYRIPPMNLLERGKGGKRFSEKEYKETAIKLQQTLKTFGIAVTVTDISCGPTVTRYELHPETGVKVGKVLSLTDDLKLALAAPDIRIEAPIPGKSAIGIEVPNKENATVMLRDIFESDEYKNSGAGVAFALGKDIGGNTVVIDICRMPHLLIAGATGSGKSVCINTLIMSILYKYTPQQVRLIMIDPKIVELSVYNGIPHLLIPVVTDVKKAAGTLNWAVSEMETRFRKFEEAGARDMETYNSKVPADEKLPSIVIIVDELADLMMQCKADVEPAIVRITQLARAAGMHMVIATQRPSVNVITGLIKGNIPSRIAFAATSGVDSRTILDTYGAERLLGKGDMLFSPQSAPKPIRIQGAYVSDAERDRVIEFIKNEDIGVTYDEETVNTISGGGISMSGQGGSESDELFAQAGRFIIDKDKASIGNLQRAFRIGFNRAARIMDQLCEAGVVGEEQGTKPREVLMTESEFEEIL